MSNLLSCLQEFGLSKKEAVLYQILLDIGSAGAHEIARSANLNRSSTYVLLEALIERGIVEQSQYNGVFKYHAISPERLVARADELAQNSLRQEEEMNSLLPELLSVSEKLKVQPHILFYEGTGGIRTVNNDLLMQPRSTEVYAFLPSPKAYLDSSSSFLKRKNILCRYKTKIISPYKKTVEDVTLDKKSRSEVRYVPANIYSFPSELRIYTDKIVFISIVEEFGVIIQSRDVANVMKSLFRLAWEEAGRLDKQIRKKKN